jgi:site-specific recombinase XerD
MDDIEIHLTQKTPLINALKSWEGYLVDQQRSKYTVRSFSGDIQLLAKYLSPDRSIGSISSQDLNHFMDWIQNGRGRNVPCSPKSFARRITSLKSFFRWLKQHGRVEVDPSDSLVQRSVISPLPEVLSKEEEKLLLDTAVTLSRGAQPDSRPLALCLLLLETGIKKSECLNLTMNHIGHEPDLGNYIFVRYNAQRDRNKERKIQISAEWMNSFEIYRNQHNIIENLFPWSPRLLEYILEDLGKAAGLSKHVSFSMCRWVCALRDIEKGLDSNLIRQKMGVSKIQWRELHAKLKLLEKSR